MRIYKTIKDALGETFRDLQVRGCTVECKSYQDKKLEGEDRYVKELMGVAFKVDKPTLNLKECIEYVFGEDSDRIIQYCEQEIKDRCSGKPLNPGNSYKIRKDMWSKFLENNKKFSYQYAERLWTKNQFKNVIDCLKNDAGTRQAVLSVWNPDKDMKSEKLGGGNRIPCSLNYQFMIRNNRLHCIYSMRSNSAIEHCPIDLYCATGLMKYVVNELKSTYKDLKIGSLTYVCGSLHAFHWNLKNFILF